LCINLAHSDIIESVNNLSHSLNSYYLNSNETSFYSNFFSKN